MLITEDFLIESSTPEKPALNIQLKRSPVRRTWSLEVRAGGEVILSAPARMHDEKIKAILKKHEDWIRKKLGRLKKVNPIRLSHPWHHGELIYFRGTHLSLALEHGQYPHVAINETEMKIKSANLQAHVVKKIFDEWMALETENEVRKLLPKWTPRFNLAAEPKVHYRILKRAWGQCRSDGKITLHKHLGRLHPEFMEYVFVHELCHLFHMNHSKAFKDLLTEMLPHWRELKRSHEPFL